MTASDIPLLTSDTGRPPLPASVEHDFMAGTDLDKQNEGHDLPLRLPLYRRGQGYGLATCVGHIYRFLD